MPHPLPLPVRHPARPPGLPAFWRSACVLGLRVELQLQPGQPALQILQGLAHGAGGGRLLPLTICLLPALSLVLCVRLARLHAHLQVGDLRTQRALLGGFGPAGGPRQGATSSGRGVSKRPPGCASTPSRQQSRQPSLAVLLPTTLPGPLAASLAARAPPPHPPLPAPPPVHCLVLQGQVFLHRIPTLLPQHLLARPRCAKYRRRAGASRGGGRGGGRRARRHVGSALMSRL
jgi:hypothetical protein